MTRTAKTKIVSPQSKFLGALCIVLGIFAMMAPGITGFSITVLVGVLVTAAGIIRSIWAFQSDSFGKGLVLFALGLLTLLCGIAMLANPLFASGILAIILAGYFIADGVIEILASFQLKPVSGWGWLLFAGIISILLGIIIIEQFPLSGVWAIGILFGIKLFFIGLIMLGSNASTR